MPNQNNNIAVPTLSYAQNLGTYAGQPIQEMKALNATLDERYKTNQSNSDKLEILLKNQKVDEKDTWIKEESITDFNQTLTEVKETGNWEHAGQLVRGLGKDFATNEALNMAVANKQAMSVHSSELQADVAAGEYPQEYANFALTQSRDAYEGVQLNEETGHFEGMYNGIKPPKYNDIAKDIYELAQKVKDDESPLYVTNDKGESTRVKWKEDGYVWWGTEEYIRPEKVAGAMRNLVLTNKNYQAQMNYEIGMQKYNATKLPDGSHRNLMSQDINQLLSPKDIEDYIGAKYGDSYSLEELEQDGQLDNMYSEILTNQKANAYIRPSEIGLSFSKESLNHVADWQLQKEYDYTYGKASAAAEQAVQTASTVIQGYSASIVNPMQIDASVNEQTGKIGVIQSIQDGEVFIKQQNQALSKINDKLANSNGELTVADKKKLEEQAEKIQLTIDLKQQEQNLLTNVTEDQYYDWLNEQGKISPDTYSELTTGKSQRLEEYGELNKKLKQFDGKWVVTKAVGPYNQKVNTTIAELEEGYIKLLNGQPGGINPFAKGALGYVKPENKEAYEKYFTYVKELNSKNKIANPNAGNEDFKTYLDKKVVNEPRTAAYYDFSISAVQSADGSSKTSHLSNQLTQVYRNHSKMDWNVFDENGAFINQDDEDQVGNLPLPKYTTITGMTDYIEGQGYMFTAREEILDEKGKSTGKFKEFLMKPKQGVQGTGMDTIIYEALHNDFNRFNKKGDNPAQFGSGAELAGAIMSSHIEQQGNLFRNVGVKEGEEFGVTYNLGGSRVKPEDRLQSIVSRTTENGITSYNLSVMKTIDGIKTRIPLNETQMANDPNSKVDEFNIKFNDLQTVESTLEQLMGMQWANMGKDGMRTDRHNNPIAVTTQIASQAGLVEGTDYIVGDAFDGSGGKSYNTAKFLGDPIKTSIKIIDAIGFHTKGGAQRWSHTAYSDEEWDAMDEAQKLEVIKEMYGKEGGTSMVNLFKNQ